MATVNPTPTTGGSSAGWRGAQRQDVARHRWQRSTDGAAYFTREPWRSLRVATWFAAAGGLAALLLYYLLYAPERTPVLAVVATEYNWPLPPNAWAAEDLQGLGDLNNETLWINDLSEAWRSKDRGLTQLTEQLAEVRRRRGPEQPMVIYLSMHGAVDGAGRACLIPPTASPQDSTTWLPLAKVFAAIDAAGLSARQPKLLVLDSNRQHSNWNIGLVTNTLSDSLAKEVQEANIPGLAILTSASSGERAIAAPELRGSVFGHFLRLGLAGAADHRASGGNGNGYVSLHELSRYLLAEVDGWVVHHVGTRQQPLLVPPDAVDFNVAVAMRSSNWRNFVERSQRIERPASVVSSAALHTHWANLDELRSSQPWRFDPVGWRTLEHRLLWLEELAAAGSAYNLAAKSLHDELEASLTQTKQKLAQAREQPSIVTYDNLLGTSTAPLPRVAGSSLPLAAFWGNVTAADERSLAYQLDLCQQAPSQLNLQATVRAFDQAQLPSPTIEQTLLGLWQRYHVPALWPEARSLSEVFAARRSAERLAAPVPATGAVGLPGDERAHAWLRSELAKLNQTCRSLEDAALLGAEKAKIDSPLALARAEIERCSQLAAELASAFALRDRLWAELPYHAQWLTRLEFDAKRQQANDAAIRQTLVPLVADGMALESQMRRGQVGAANPTELNWTGADAVHDVERGWGELNRLWSHALQHLQAAPAAADSVAEIDIALASPLVPADIRQRLRQKRTDIFSGLAGQYYEDDTTRPPASSTVSRYRERIASWGQLPLAQMFPSIAAEGGKSLDIAATEERIRQELRILALADLTDPSATVKSARIRDAELENKASAELPALALAESRVRTASALWFDAPADDPIRSLMLADLQQLLLASAARALDDFYGPPNSGSSEPLFAIAAEHDLTAAATIAPPTPQVQMQLAALRSLLAKRRVAAIEALAVQANDILLIEQANTISSSIVVRPRPGGGLADLPEGQLTVFLADQLGRIGNDAWAISRDTPVKDDALLQATTTIASANVTDRGPHLDAVATLRGNDFVAPLLLRAPAGIRVEFDRPEYGPPQVSVFGSELRRASLVFVLDCSHSMKEPTFLEGPDGASREQSPRLDVAKGALRAMLAEVADRGAARVGVQFFGHRVGWSTALDNKLLRQTAWPGEIPAELRPYADVESILKLGRFDAAAAGVVSEKLAAVQPWGESPLYLAISQALAEFGGEDDAQRSVIVVTDGRDYQFNPPEGFQRSTQQIIAAAQQAKASIFIVGFDISGEASAAVSEFEAIAAGTGGKYLPANGATTFLKQIESLLQPGEFQVTTAAGASKRAQLGQTITVPLPGSHQELTVSYEGLREEANVFGGERVELAVSRGERRLRVPLFQSPRRVPLLLPGGSRSTLFAGLHRAARSKEGMVFSLSLQDDDGRFVSRPGELWVEITPVLPLAEEEPTPYIFYDAPYMPGTPVPLVRLAAGDWPAAATRASVRLWSRDLPAEPLDRVPLAKVANAIPDEPRGFPVTDANGVFFQARTTRGSSGELVVGIVERHTAESGGVGSLKVALTPPADHVVHQFDSRDRVVLHTFTFRNPAENLADRLEIQFTSRDSVLAGALRLERDAEVNVAPRSDLIENSSPE